MSGLDIPYDKRWGRVEECYSEDPYVAGCFIGTAIKNLQTENKRVSVTAKHFIAYGAAENGKNGANSNIGKRELHEIHLEPFKHAVAAGVDSVMVAYNDIDGVPCVANEYLLKNIARKEYDFKGLFMADGFAIDALVNNLGISKQQAAKLAFDAGVNLSLWDTAYLEIEQMINMGILSIEKLDEHVLSVLMLKNKQNLINENFNEIREICNKEEGKKINIDIACSASVLLKNKNNLLPLKQKKQNFLVVGDNLDDIYYQIGDYSPFIDECSTYKDCFDKLNMNNNVTFLSLDEVINKNINFKNFDIVFAFCGGNSKRDFNTEFDKNGAAKTSKLKTMTSGEGVDLSNLNIIEKQKEAILKINHEKIILICTTGKPIVFSEIIDNIATILILNYPGQRGGEALYSILVGDKEPSGRLSYTYPRYSGINNLSYNSRNKNNYKYFDLNETEELYEFGYGLGYGDKSIFKLKSYQIKDNKIDLLIELHNANNFQRNETIFIFEIAKNMPLSTRKQVLKKFCKASVNSNDKKELKISLDINEFIEFSLNEKYEIIDKFIELQIGYSCKDIVCKINVEISDKKFI